MITQRGLMSPRSNNQIRTESGIRPGHSHIHRSMSQHVSRPGPIRRPEGPPRTTPTRPPAPDPPPTTQRIRTSHRPTELGAELRAATRRPLMASLDSHGRALRRIATRRRHRPTARRTSRTTSHRATGCRSLGSGAAESSEAESSELAFEDGWAGDRMTDLDYRGPTPLFWRPVAPYGEVRLNMTKRLTLSTPT